jgi:hypothetical protein
VESSISHLGPITLLAQLTGSGPLIVGNRRTLSVSCECWFGVNELKSLTTMPLAYSKPPNKTGKSRVKKGQNYLGHWL